MPVVTPDLVVIVDDQFLLGLSPSTGTVKWRTHLGGLCHDAVVANGTCWVAVSKALPSSQPYDSVVACDIGTGQRLWSHRFPSPTSSMIIHDGALFVIDRDSKTGYSLIKFTPAHLQ
jgi:outer membrane protein assembly factor BamB